MNHIIRAKLNQDVAFVKNKKVISVKKDTEVYIDLSRNIAFHDGNHFDVFPEEFTFDYPLLSGIAAPHEYTCH